MISIIIPVFNEQDQIVQTIQSVRQKANGALIEIIVADGGSNDDTVQLAKTSGAMVITARRKGRAVQMNDGAKAAKGTVLYFLHADSIPPDDFIITIGNAIRYGAVSGCFRLRFDFDHWFLKANCWFTRWDVNAVRFGDQSLFTLPSAFVQSGGFREDLLMMEDQEIIHRLKRQGKFRVMNTAVTTSARKYLDNGIYRMQGIFFMIWTLYYIGVPQERLLVLYRRMIRRHKL